MQNFSSHITQKQKYAQKVAAIRTFFIALIPGNLAGLLRKRGSGRLHFAVLLLVDPAHTNGQCLLSLLFFLFLCLCLDRSTGEHMPHNSEILSSKNHLNQKRGN